MEPKTNNDIAIIVPIYNAGRERLNRCIEALVNQTCNNIKIILVDDGSKDDSGTVCDEWKERDARIYVIHQENQGSIAARRNGLNSETAQECLYSMFCDADDTYVINGIEALYNAANTYSADCVCGQIRSIKGGVKYVSKRECFDIDKPKAFTHKEIIDHIYLSCFGLIDYPVCYYGKLYRTSVLTKAFEFKPIVHFMGEDLNLTILLLPMLDSLVLIPDVVYNYYDGGITSKFMPYAFDDFLALYKLKAECAEKYFVDDAKKEAYHFMKNEMMWITLSRFTDVYTLARYTRAQMKDEILRVCEIDIVKEAAQYVSEEKHPLKKFATDILNKNEKRIFARVKKDSIEKKLRKFVKRILMKIK